MSNSIKKIQDKKKRGEKIIMLTAYDYPFAKILDEAGVDIILVGDSVANVVLGLKSTPEVGMAEMLHHSKAVSRGVKNALLIGDMPFEAYQKNKVRAVENAQRFIDEAGCQAVKLEWFDGCLDVVGQLKAAGIPVMGHVGLTPQTADKLGGFKVQGKDSESAQEILKNARELEKAGCFAVVLECIPSSLAKEITKALKIPTIGIGAGVDCDGQVLVLHDLLGLSDRAPKFAKAYTDLKKETFNAVKKFIQEVEESHFPDKEHSF